MSVYSYPDRGPWGSAKWRGNCSGYFYADLFSQLKPASFVDAMVGSGTSVEVAREMGIQAYGLDLHCGFNVLRHSIRAAVGEPVDLSLTHPPYGDMIVYSGAVWGKPHGDDLSRCNDVDDFFDKMVAALLNQRDSVRAGGHYGTIIGDQRKQGRYISYQAELIARMPRDELRGVLVKVQHNTLSGQRQYGALRYPRIEHEYCVLWQRPDKTVAMLPSMAKQAAKRVRSAWASAIRMALIQIGGKGHLKDIYRRVRDIFPEGAETNRNIDAKVRQVLQRTPWFRRSERGVWELAPAG